MDELAKSYVLGRNVIQNGKDLAALVAMAEGARQRQVNPHLYKENPQRVTETPYIALDPEFRSYFKAGFNIQGQDKDQTVPLEHDGSIAVATLPIARPFLEIFSTLQLGIRKGNTKHTLASFFSGYQQQRAIQQTRRVQKGKSAREDVSRQEQVSQLDMSESTDVSKQDPAYIAGRKLANVAKILEKAKQQNKYSYREAMNLIQQTSDRQAQEIVDVER